MLSYIIFGEKASIKISAVNIGNDGHFRGGAVFGENTHKI